ncbi:MAG: CRISPR-associated helicase Cas3' [Methanobacteriaceae archaeon]|jgi:CRISPR-associated endonuclease/helicase Cas3|nr:CRISPR-associated helicase Cas3' [Candidatus Methanorudis spinitermitis]
MDIYDLRYNNFKSSFKLSNDDEFKIYAHENELLFEHIEKTKKTFNKICDFNLIIKFYEYFHGENVLNTSYDQFLDIINKMIEFHDVGKISFNFQINRLNKYNHKIRIEQQNILKKHKLSNYIDAIEANHSITSSMLFFSYLHENYDLENNSMLIILAYIIYGHHTGIKNVLIEEGFAYDLNSSLEKTLNWFYEFTNNDFYPFCDYQDIQDQFIEEELDTNELDLNTKISFFYSYVYSLLISADVIASSYYSKSIDELNLNNWNNRLDEAKKSEMYYIFHELDINKDLKELTSLNNLDFSDSINDINILRRNMLLESSFNLNTALNNFPSKKVFFLNMPTGAGKTNTSMKLALEILKNTDVDRIIYSMPFINIIEQNYDIIRDNFGLNEEIGEIREIYSASESIFPDSSDEYKSEAIIKDDFFDYPVICTTFVSLFNTIIKSKKKYKYALSHLTNSVIILDEIQSLPFKNWSSLYYLINELSKNFNIYFIIMSATLPDFNSLKLNTNSNITYDSIHLIKNPEKYFNHPLFKRTKIISDVKDLDTEDPHDLFSYFNEIIKDNFEKGFNKGLIVLNTIKTSKLIFEYVTKLGNKCGFKTELLNSTIIPLERRKIIDRINEMDCEKYILVSTQSIEAGVDVSFDFVVRDFTVLDSIEQVRGRCNRSRELNKYFKDENIKGNVYITNIQRKGHFEYSYIYTNEEIENRINESMSILKNKINYEYNDILEYYNNISQNINSMHEDKKDNFVFKDLDNIKHWQMLQYYEISNKEYGINIIDKKESNSFSFFVSTNIEINIEDNSFDINNMKELYEKSPKKFNFSYNEINYLKDCAKEHGINLIQKNKVIGSNLIELYTKMYNEASKDFVTKKIIQKEFSSILYKFIFQVANNDIEDIISSEDLKQVGYFFVIPKDKVGNNVNDIYSLESGFNFNFELEEHDWEVC